MNNYIHRVIGKDKINKPLPVHVMKISHRKILDKSVTSKT